jgi:hypothetical protein
MFMMSYLLQFSMIVVSDNRLGCVIVVQGACIS